MKLQSYFGPAVSLRALATSVTSVVGSSSLIAPAIAACLWAPPAASTRIGAARTEFDGDGHHALVQGMLDEPAFAIVDVAQHFADAAIFAQRLAVGLADEREARDRRFGSERADADHHRVERLGEIVDLAEPATLDERLLGRRAVDERGRGNEIAVGVESMGEGGGELSRIVLGEAGDPADQRDDAQTPKRPLAQIFERTIEGASPAKADLHVVAQQRRDVIAERGADRRGRVGGRRGERRNDRLGESVEPA